MVPEADPVPALSSEHLPATSRRPRVKLSLRPNHTLALIGLVVIVAAGALSAYFVCSLYESQVVGIRNRLAIPAEAADHATQSMARDAELALGSVEASVGGDELVPGENVPLLRALRYLSVSPSISRIEIYDATGKPVASSAPAPLLQASVAGEDFFKQQLDAADDRIFVSNLVPDPLDGSPQIVFSRRLIDRSGHLRGVAAVYVAVSYLQRVFDSLHMPPHSSISVFSRSGHILVRMPAIRLDDPELAIDFSKRPAFQALLSANGAETFQRFTTFGGFDRFIAGVGSPEAPFVVTAAWTARAALVTWRAESLAIVSSTLLGLIIAIALLFLLRAQIGRNEALLAAVSLSEKRQRDLLMALPDAVAMLDKSLTIEFANRTAERLFGYGSGALNGLPWASLMAPHSSDDGDQQISFDEPNSAEILGLMRVAKRRDGGEFPVEISHCAYATPEGEKRLAIIRDITIRQAQQRALRRSQENLEQAQRLAALGSFDCDLTTEAIECSAEFLHIWGFGPDERPSYAELVARVHPEDRRKFRSVREAVMQGQPVAWSSFRIMRADGEERFLYHDYRADFDAAGRPIRLFGIAQDVTERVKQDAELRSSQENLARAQRVAAIGSFDRDLVTGRIEWSEQFLKNWGLGAMPESGATELLLSLVHPDDRAKFIEGRAAALDKKPIPPLDFRIMRPDGEKRVLHREFGVIFDAAGRPIRLFGTVQDITERKTIETELRRNQQDMARAQQVAGIGSFSRDIATGQAEWSAEFRRIWGLENFTGQVTAEFLSQMIHPDDREAFLSGRAAALRNESHTSLDFRITRPDGEERILHREYGVVFDEDGKPVRMFGTVQDITERKRIEIELRRSRENLARAQRLAGIGSFECDFVTGKYQWSPELCHIHGLPMDAPDLLEQFRAVVHPEDRATFDEVCAMANNGIAAPPLDFRIIRPDGAERVLHRECEVQVDESGRPLRMTATLQDITERRRVVNELHRSRENLVQAQRLAGIGSFERDLLTGAVEWSDEVFRIFGLDPANGVPGREALIGFIHPEDRKRFREAHASDMTVTLSAPFEYRILRTDGAERILRRETAHSYDSDNRPIRIYGTLQDITERKRVEAEILRSRENMASAQRIANMGSFDHDFASGRTVWSDQMFRILGLEKETVTPSSDLVLAMTHPDDRDRIVAQRRLVRQGRPAEPLEFRIFRVDGEERIVRREHDVQVGADGQVLRVFGTMQDITELRLAEARERELERQLLHSQKLEALGTLAGGIAHDLNNTLVPVMALSKLMARQFEPGTPVRNNLQTIYEASERARDLVRRVLSFSRKEDGERQEVNIAEVVREALKLLRATVPTSIAIDAAIADVPAIRADVSQIHQVITNLVSNAAGAIGGEMGSIGVTLGIATRRKGTGEVCLSVVDSGCGMDEATRQRIFEPFFTTKPVGEGTGLGLSIVHGIIASHGGEIEVKSVPGKGTRFDIYFPLAESEPGGTPSTSERPAA